MIKTKQLPLLKEMEREPVPKLRVYECPYCHDRTESEIALAWVFCPVCRKWYRAPEALKRSD